MKKLYFLLLLFITCSLSAFAGKHDIKDFYVEISVNEAKQYGFDETYNNRYFSKVKLESGIYEVEVGEQLDSKFYRIEGTKYYMLFRYSPYLYRWDDGIIKVTNGYDAGEFIETD